MMRAGMDRGRTGPGAGESGGHGFPCRLQRLRERRRMDRKALGECCGLSKNMIGMYERGEKEPSVRSLMEIADFFEVSTDYLLGRKSFF